MKKVGKFLGTLWPTVAFIGTQGIGVFIGIFVLMFCLIFAGYDIDENSFQVWMPELLSFATLTTAVMGALWYGLGYRKKYEYKVKEVLKAIDFLYIGILAIACVFATDIVTNIVTFIFPNALNSYSEMIESAGIGNSVIMFLSVIFLAPIGEECIFRGVTLRKAEKYMPFIAANILQAFLFGLVHMNIVQSTYAFVLGLVLGYVRHKYENIKATMFMHMIFNICGQVIPMFAGDYPKLVDYILVIASLPIMALLLLVIRCKDVPSKMVEDNNQSDGMNPYPMYNQWNGNGPYPMYNQGNGNGPYPMNNQGNGSGPYPMYNQGNGNGPYPMYNQGNGTGPYPINNQGTGKNPYSMDNQTEADSIQQQENE